MMSAAHEEQNKEKKEEIKELHKKMNVLEKMCKGLQVCCERGDEWSRIN